jgi:hypothetical protein
MYKDSDISLSLYIRIPLSVGPELYEVPRNSDRRSSGDKAHPETGISSP